MADHDCGPDCPGRRTWTGEPLPAVGAPLSVATLIDPANPATLIIWCLPVGGTYRLAFLGPFDRDDPDTWAICLSQLDVVLADAGVPDGHPVHVIAYDGATGERIPGGDWHTAADG